MADPGDARARRDDDRTDTSESESGQQRTYDVVRGTLGDDAPADRLIHQRTRLAIVSALAVNDSLTFNELKALLEVSDGNLSVHARKLEEGGYLECSKSFENRMPRTEYRLTEAGRRALERYLDHMQSLIRAVRGG